MATGSGNELTLSGSCEQIREFFSWVVQMILYQRGIYDPKHFEREQRYRQVLFRATDPQLQAYLAQIMSQLDEWVDTGKVQRLVLVIHGLITQQTLERWTFLLRVDDPAASTGRTENVDGNLGDEQQPQKPTTVPTAQDAVKAAQRQIAALMRQVTSSVTYLPMIEEECSFELEVYANEDVETPKAWAESDPKLIVGEQQSVRLRSFTTSLHVVDSVVQYKIDP